jgi:hypothetical protein
MNIYLNLAEPLAKIIILKDIKIKSKTYIIYKYDLRNKNLIYYLYK